MVSSPAIWVERSYAHRPEDLVRRVNSRCLQLGPNRLQSPKMMFDGFTSLLFHAPRIPVMLT